jgi:hypothetical protein
MHPPVATPTVEQYTPELPLQFGLRLEELYPEALGGDNEP